MTKEKEKAVEQLQVIFDNSVLYRTILTPLYNKIRGNENG